MWNTKGAGGESLLKGGMEGTSEGKRNDVAILTQRAGPGTSAYNPSKSIFERKEGSSGNETGVKG